MGNHILSWIEAVASLIGLAAVVFAAGRFTESMKVNTVATEKLTTVIDGHLTWSAEQAQANSERFHEHNVRITVLEKAAEKS